MRIRITIISALTALLPQTLTLAQPEPGPTAAPKHTELHKPTVSVPMDNWGNRPVVLVKVNGQGPFRLLLDTGTSFAAVLDDDLVERANIPTTSKAPAIGSGGEPDLVEVKTITIGDAEFSKVKVRRADFSSFMPPGPKTPEGILGLPLFADCLLTLDYPGRKVILESGELPDAGGDIIEYSPDKERDFGVTIEMSVAGVPVKAHVDTGSPEFVTLLTKMQDKLPLTGKPIVVGMARTPSGGSEVRAATLDGTLKIGTHEFVKPKIAFADLGPMVDHNCGNVGYRMLKDFSVTLDQKNRRLRLRKGK